MKTLTSIKLAALTIVLTGLTSGAALAGDGHKKDCKKHDKTVMKQDAKAAKAGHAVMTADQAIKACTEMKVADLQSCIDRKMGKAKPGS